MSNERVIALNALDFIKGFKDAFAEAGAKERVSTEHMETFFFIMTSREQGGLELRRLQKALGYAQAKMHRTVNVLENLGWIETKQAAEDMRQKLVWITPVGLNFFEGLSNSLSERSNYSAYYDKTVSDMLDGIEQDAAIRAATPETRRRQFLQAADRLEAADPSADVKLTKLSVSKARRALHAFPKVVRKLPTAEELDRLRTVLAAKNEDELEVGKDYLKTGRGIVTFAVLFRRFKSADINKIANELEVMAPDAYNKILTPTPKTIKERLELKLKAEKSRLNFLMGRLGSSTKTQDEMLLQSAMGQVAALEAELAAIEAKEKLAKLEAATDAGDQ